MKPQPESLFAQALAILGLDPHKGAVKRDPQGNKYLEVGYVKAIMQQAFGLAYSSESKLIQVELYPDKNRRGEDCWSAWATAHARVTIGGCCVREGIGVGDAQNLPGRAAAVNVAAKGAESDAYKRACFGLGNRVGLGLRPGSAEAIAPAASLETSLAGLSDRIEASEAAAEAEDERAAIQASEMSRLKATLAWADVPAALPGAPTWFLEDLTQLPEYHELLRPEMVYLWKIGVEAIGRTELEALFALLGFTVGKGLKITAGSARIILQLIATATKRTKAAS